ncbi:MAG: hypothetical protein M3546_14910 [Actinomycetota bacterium]|nr:hypothetical protein [Actinomycetota bacterium]
MAHLMYGEQIEEGREIDLAVDLVYSSKPWQPGRLRLRSQLGEASPEVARLGIDPQGASLYTNP